MQVLQNLVIKKAKKKKMLQLEKELREGFSGSSNGERCLCPICKYTSNKNKMSAFIFVNGEDKALKCFACGIWRRI